MLVNLSDGLAWVTRCDGVIRHILGDHAASSNHGILPDGDAWQDDGSCSNPGPISNGDGKRVHAALGPFLRVDGMAGSAQRYARPEQAAFTDGHLVIIDQNEA